MLDTYIWPLIVFCFELRIFRNIFHLSLFMCEDTSSKNLMKQEKLILSCSFNAYIYMYRNKCDAFLNATWDSMWKVKKEKFQKAHCIVLDTSFILYSNILLKRSWNGSFWSHVCRECEFISECFLFRISFLSGNPHNKNNSHLFCSKKLGVVVVFGFVVCS